MKKSRYMELWKKTLIQTTLFVVVVGFVFGLLKSWLNTEYVYVSASREVQPEVVNETEKQPSAALQKTPPLRENLGEIESYILKVFGEDDYEIALAIAKAESGLNPKAYNDNTWWGGVGEDRGIFQINNVYHSIPDECAYDYKCNILYAKEIRDSWGNWLAWSAYKNKSFEEHL